MSDLQHLYQTYRQLNQLFEKAAEVTRFADPEEAEAVEPALKEAYKNLKLAIICELRATNKLYQVMHQQNLKLIQTEGFKLSVTKIKTTTKPFAKFSTRFEGGILSNGYLYMRSVETNSNFTLKSYASYLQGTLDEHGFGEVDHTETEAEFLQTLPAVYKGKIGADGSFHLQVLELDPTLERRLIAFEITGDPFKRNEKKRQLFLQNRADMNRLIAERIHELGKQV